MKRLITICLVLSVVFVSSQAAFATWNVGDLAKYVQLPDLSTTGVDVAFSEILLGDDFKCESTEAITDFHLWTSWKNDYLPGYDDGAGGFIATPDAVGFGIAIYSDIPAGTGGINYSRPGEELWWTWAENYTTAPTTFTVDYYDTAVEDWYDPVTGEYSQADHSGVWQYNFYVDTAFQDPFIQRGTAADPVTYWLVVDAFVWGMGENPDIDPELGWKTSLEQWQDDAVWGTETWDPDLYEWVENWSELRYPVGHLYEGRTMDLAFVITPEPATVCLLGLGSLALLRRKTRA